MTDVTKKIVEIGRRLGLKPGELEDMEKFIDAVYNYIVKQDQRQQDRDEKNELLTIVAGSKTLEDPIRAYLLLRTLEERMYAKGFEDGIKMSKNVELEEVRKKQIEIMKKVLDVYEKSVLPYLNAITQMFQPSQSQIQQQQPNVKIKFKE